MTHNQILHMLYGEAEAAQYRDAYIAEWAASSVFREDADPAKIVMHLGGLWDTANLPFRDLRARTGLTQVELAARLCTSRRTVENWDSGQRSCSPTIRILVAETFGLLDVPALLNCLAENQ